MKKSLIALGGLLVVLAGTAVILFTTLRNQENGHFTAAQAAYVADQHNEAITLFNQALAVQPDFVRQHDEAALRGRAFAHFGDENYQAAIDDVTAVLAQNPDTANAPLDPAPETVQNRQNLLQLRADAYLATGQFEDGITDLDSLLAQNPDDINLLILRARANDALNNQEAALADYEAIITQDPTLLEPLLWRFNYLQANVAPQAVILAAAEAIMSADESIGAPFLLRGRSLLDERQDEAALADFEAAAADDATRLDGLAWQGVVHLLNERSVEALARADEVLAEAEHPLAVAVFGAASVAQGDEVNGMEALNTAVSKADTDLYPYALYLRGLAHLQQDDSSAALSDAELLIGTAPQWSWGYLLRGDAHLARQELPQASFSYQQAIEIAPDFGVAIAGRAAHFLASGDVSAARADLDQALGLMPDYLPAIILRAETAVAEGNLDEALTQLERALAIDPERPSLLATRADIFLAQERWEEAVADYTAVLAANPDEDGALAGRGIANFELGNFEAAITDLSAAIAQNPRDVDLIVRRAEAYLRQDDLEAALRDSNRALALDDDEPLPYLVKGLSLIEEGDMFQAVVELTEAIDLDPNLAAAYAARGRAYFLLEDDDRARADANRAIDLDPELGAGYIVQALVHTFDLRWREALTAVDRAVELMPDETLPLQTRGIIYLDSGDANAALDDFNRVIDLDPMEINGYLLKAAAFDEMGRYADAIETLDEALALANEAGFEDGRVDVSDIELAESTIADLERIPDLVEDSRTWNDTYAGFTVTYPGEWRQFVDPGSEAPILLLGPLDKDYRSNLNMLVLNFDFRPDLNDLVRFYNIDNSQFDDFELIEDERIRVDGRSAVRRVFRFTTSDQRLRDVSFTITQVYIVDGQRAIIVTTFSRSEDAEKYGPIFEEIVGSLRFD